MKVCIKCAVEKSLSGYYAHPKTSDGLMGACKECTKAAALRNRARNIDRVRAHDRARGSLSHRKAGVKARAHRYKSRRSAVTKRYNIAHAERRKAHVLIGNAIRKGSLLKQPCERCQSVKNIHAHHEDYSKPLVVVWLCQPCHGQRHREINELKRQGKWPECEKAA